MAEKLSVRVERLEESERRVWTVLESLADKEAKLDDALVVLADAQIKTQTRIEDLTRSMKDGFERTDARFEELMRSMKEESKKTDARIENLVSAIGQMLRNGGKQR
jgi:DNA anti-recombination protein RmuC